ncbi:hypothetical protein Tco_1446600 [Tanacetum coccineum]
MKTIDNISKARINERAKLLKALNRVSEILKVDFVLKEEMKKMAESYTTTSGNLSGMSSSTPSVSASIPTALQPEVHESIRGEFREAEEIKKKAEEARLLEMTNFELIKVVYEEVEKARIDPKIVLSAKGGEQFKKIQDAEH